MKITFCVLLLLILPGRNSAQNFFPLQVGDVYQIKDVETWTGPGGTGGSETYFKVNSVIYDSVINGETFYAVSLDDNYGPFHPGYLFRYDSLNQKLFVKIPGDDTVRLAVDFDIPQNSSYISYFNGEPYEYISGGIMPEVFWGDTLQVYKMESPWLTGSYYSYNFAGDIGFSFFKHSNGGGSLWASSEFVTVSAIIDSNIFHPLILQIDSLYPVIDRPINTFPFLLSTPFHVTYYQLIKYFQLTMEVERDSEIVLSTNSNISVFDPHIQINPPDLQIGDLIKLKVTITDSSIFNNVDVYPDSGWVTFRVLGPVSVNGENLSVSKYKLEQNFPNPFNPVTVISYEIPERTYVSVKVYDILGNAVASMVNKEQLPGNYNLEFNAENLSSGVYICRFRTNEFSKTIKMILAK